MNNEVENLKQDTLKQIKQLQADTQWWRLLYSYPKG